MRGGKPTTGRSARAASVAVSSEFDLPEEDETGTDRVGQDDEHDHVGLRRGGGLHVLRVGVGFRTIGGVVGNGGAGVSLGIGLTLPAKDDPIDPVEFTGAMIRRF